MNPTQERVYKYIKYLCEGVTILHEPIPVVLSIGNIAETLGVHELTVKRNLEWLILNQHIYRYKITNTYYYSVKPIDTTKDFVCRVRVQVTPPKAKGSVSVKAERKGPEGVHKKKEKK